MRRLGLALAGAFALAGCAQLGLTPPTSPGAAVQDGKVLCALETGTVVLVAGVDPSLISHNTVALSKAAAVCAAVNAVPVPQPAPNATGN